MSEQEYYLKPCPFCGGKAKLQHIYRYNQARVYCSKCGASTMEQTVTFSDASAAADFWNTRVEVSNDPT